MINIDSILTLLFIFLPVIFAVVCLVCCFSFLRNARALEDNPDSKIRSAAQGYVELSGTTKPLPNQPLLGKLTQKPCAWYSYRIEEFKVTRNENGFQVTWYILDQGSSFEPFLIEDGTGECIVLPKGAEVIHNHTTSWRGQTPFPLPPSHSFWAWLLWESWGRYRYTEYCIDLNTPLFISGRFITLKANDQRLQEYPSLSAYLKEKNLTSISILEKEGLAPNETFMLSAIPETRLIKRLRWKALIFFIAFLFFISLSFNSSYPLLKKTLQEWPLKAPTPHPRGPFSYSYS